MRISHQLVPNGGWKFLQDGIWFYEQTWDDLLKSVINYRVANNLPIGNPIEEIEDYIADKYPELIINGQLKKK